MADVWYLVLGVTLTGYVVLDGFDLGVGALHVFLGKTEGERRAMIRSIGPVWDGNEVWLIASGGILVCAFPAAYASAFSGFYLPLIMVLWFLIFRGLAIELRSHLESPLWRQAWDVAFGLSSGALALFLGVALGNVVRGVDLDPQGRFFAPMWTDWTTSGGETGILDWYTLSVGALGLACLLTHGATWVALKTTEPLASRATALARRLGMACGVAFVIVSSATAWVAPHVRERIADAPLGAMLFLGPVGALWWHRRRLDDRRPMAAFMGSTLLIVSLIGAAVFGVYPYILPASTAATGSGLTAAGAAASDLALKTAIGWWIPAAVLVAIYHVVVYRGCRGRIPTEEERVDGDADRVSAAGAEAPDPTS